MPGKVIAVGAWVVLAGLVGYGCVIGCLVRRANHAVALARRERYEGVAEPSFADVQPMTWYLDDCFDEQEMAGIREEARRIGSFAAALDVLTSPRILYFDEEDWS